MPKRFELDAGEMDQRLTLQQPVVTEDALGQRVTAWTTVAEVWGSAHPLRSRELLAADGQHAEATVRFRIRWRAGVLHTWRVLWRGVPHAIVGDPIDVRGQRIALELMCTTGAAAA